MPLPPPTPCSRSGLLLSPGGEFAFVLFGEAVSRGIMGAAMVKELYLVVALRWAGLCRCDWMPGALSTVSREWLLSFVVRFCAGQGAIPARSMALTPLLSLAPLPSSTPYTFPSLPPIRLLPAAWR